jgi:beta-lactamase regulating signal transducer with metallopeptidase domain
MMLSWILSALLAGACVVLAAHAIESVAGRMGWSRRASWIAGLISMCAVPFLPRLVTQPFADRVVAATASPTSSQPATVVTSAPTQRARASSPLVDVPRRMTTARANRVILAVWALLVACACTIVARAVLRLRAAKRSWTLGSPALHVALRDVTGRDTPVWVAEHIGPAAFGLARMEVVLPQWALELPDHERALLLAHEGAHVRAHDPRALAAALALVVLLPWHLPVLYAYRRLCRAVEHDCDARVLAANGDPREYGRLLVRTAELVRTSRVSLASRVMLTPVPAFAARASELESRLRALVREQPTPRGRAKVIGSACAAVAALFLSTTVPFPRPSLDANAATPSGSAAGPLSYPNCRTDVMPMTSAPSPVERFISDCLRDAILARPATLDSLRAAEIPLAWIILDESGQTLDLQTGMAGTERVNAGRTLETPWVSGGPGGDSFVVTGVAMRAKFPAFATRIRELTLWNIRVGAASVHVVYSVLRNPSLLDSAATQLVPRGRPSPPLAAAAIPMVTPRGYPPCKMDVVVVSPSEQTRGQRYHSDCMRDAIAERAPELTREDGPTERTAWIVLGPTGETLAFATGADGTRPITDYNSLSGTKMTLSSAAGSFSVSEDALIDKFPALANQIRGLGVTSVRFGDRVVNVIYARARLK